MHRLKSTAPNVKVELYLNTDPIDPVDDKKIIAHMPLRDKMVIMRYLGGYINPIILHVYISLLMEKLKKGFYLNSLLNNF